MADRPIPNDPTVDFDDMKTGPGTGRGTGPDGAPDRSLYRQESILGEGGMGLVYRASDVRLERKVALKTLRNPGAAKPETVARFLREARVTAQLDHPNVVPIYVLESGTDGNVSYAMKLVEGRTLLDLILETSTQYQTTGKTDAAHALEARLEHFLKICDAMAFAHSRGVIHRDLKPANIMIGRYNEVYVMDWGLARPIGGEHAEARPPVDGQPPVAEGDSDLTLQGNAVGTPRYMSPEQARGDNSLLDGRSDQYSLGLILFELVTLKRAVPGGNPVETLTNAMRGVKAPMLHVDGRQRVPPELNAIVHRATAANREHRYASVEALADDVRRFLRGEAVLARPDSAMQAVLRFMTRHRVGTLMALATVLLVSAMVVSWSLYQRKAEELAARERGERLRAFLTAVSQQSHRIDSIFLTMEEALEGLATAATWALTGPEPTGAVPVYFHEDFLSPDRKPPDFPRKTAYRWPISLDAPVAGAAPDTPRATVLPALRRLAPLTDHFRRMFVDAATDGRKVLAPEEADAQIGSRRGPIDYAYVCLPEGVLYMYPGMGSLPDDYDVRTAGFYKMSDHRHGKRWGNPYVDSTTDAQGDDLVLPCTTGLWDAKGRFLGVAGVEVTFNKMISTAMRLPDMNGILATYLVDGEGRVVVSSLDENKRFQTNGSDEAIELSPYPIDSVRVALLRGKSDVVEAVRDGRPVLVGFWRLDVLGWSFVVEADPARLLAAPAP